MTTHKYWVRYSYDGGAGEEILSADSAEEATIAAMQRAQPHYAADPSTPCVHRGTDHLYGPDVADASTVRVVYDLTWDRRDRGGVYLVVERGALIRDTHRWYTGTAKLVGTARSEAGAQRVHTRAVRRLHGTSGRVDIVRRTDVILRTTGAPYGCLAGYER